MNRGHRTTSWVYCVRGEWRVSLAPEVDAAHLWTCHGDRLAGGWQYRSLALALNEWRRMAGDKRMAYTSRIGTADEKATAERKRRWKRRLTSPLDGHFVRFSPTLSRDRWQAYAAIWREWRSHLVGRSLLLSEVKRLLLAKDAARGEWSERTLAQGIQAGVLKGEVRVLSGILMMGGQARWECMRCHSGRHHLRQSMCANCGGECVYCKACLLLGRSRACEPFLQFVVGSSSRDDPLRIRSEGHGRFRPQTSLSLTAAQRRAAKAAVRFVERGIDPVLLMWAVTGAGKTEMTFDVVADVLDKGGRVAIATPRKDVVNELSPRFRKAFPGARMVTLHGDSGETWLEGELVIATTHQLLRWYRAFDLIIVDEVDAFPYRHDKSLQAGLARALKTSGQQVWLTATPPRAWQKAFHRGELPGVTIPARYHRHPLPEPSLMIEGRLWQRIKSRKPIPSIETFFEHVQRVNGQAYVFVPGLSHLAPVRDWLSHYVADVRAVAVSSRDRNRSAKVARFRNKEYDCLVTTTILERGVTVRNAHVLILQADHVIFDEAALVQMSGRSGRSAEYPDGLVRWVAIENTREQQRARKHIRLMNQEAKRHGWLRND